MTCRLKFALLANIWQGPVATDDSTQRLFYGSYKNAFYQFSQEPLLKNKRYDIQQNNK